MRGSQTLCHTICSLDWESGFWPKKTDFMSDSDGITLQTRIYLLTLCYTLSYTVVADWYWSLKSKSRPFRNRRVLSIKVQRHRHSGNLKVLLMGDGATDGGGEF